MLSSERVEFGKIMMTLATLYTSEMNKAVLEIYWRNLIEYPLEEIKIAVDLHVKDPVKGRFLPRPADIIGNMHGDSGVRSIVAWEGILKALRSGVLDHEFSTGTAAGDRALRAIGIYSLKMGREIDQHFLAKRFSEYYEAFDKPTVSNILKVDFTKRTRALTDERS